MGIKSKKNTSIPHSCPTMRRIMKLGTLMSVVLVSQLHAENVFSQNEAISVSMKNVTVGQVLDQIEKNSDYTFIFTDKSVDTIVR